MTIDPTTATLDECRDWLAGRAGWAKITDGDSGRWFWHIPGVPTARDYYESPIPETLDAAFNLIPSGWTWTREYLTHPDAALRDKGLVMCWQATHKYCSCVRLADTGDMLLDVFRLSVACCTADDERAQIDREKTI